MQSSISLQICRLLYHRERSVMSCHKHAVYVSSLQASATPETILIVAQNWAVLSSSHYVYLLKTGSSVAACVQL